MELDISGIATNDYMKECLDRIRGRSVYLYGAGSFGREICLFLRDNGVDICGFLDQRAAEIKEYCGKPVYTLEEAPEAKKRENTLVLFSIVMDKDERRKVINAIEKSGYSHVEEAQFYRSIQIIPEDLLGRELGEYYIAKRDRIREAYDSLGDEKSRRIYGANIKAHFCKDFSECPQWEDAMAEQYFPRDIALTAGYGRTVDCGGFVGDTVESLLENRSDVRSVAVFEPDICNFRHMTEACEWKKVQIICFPCAVSDSTGFQSFSSAVGSGSLCDEGDTRIMSIALDEALIGYAPSFIKMDIEGAELRALTGAKRMICESVPDLAICVYHHINHLWDILLLLRSWKLGYKFYLRNYNAYTMETVLYATRGED